RDRVRHVRGGQPSFRRLRLRAGVREDAIGIVLPDDEPCVTVGLVEAKDSVAHPAGIRDREGHVDALEVEVMPADGKWPGRRYDQGLLGRWRSGAGRGRRCCGRRWVW